MNLSKGFADLFGEEFKVSEFDIAVESVRIVAGLISTRSIAELSFSFLIYLNSSSRTGEEMDLVDLLGVKGSNSSLIVLNNFSVQSVMMGSGLHTIYRQIV